jgi:hypothetical protein
MSFAQPRRVRIVKIRNPAGRAGTFTFDKGMDCHCCD